MPAFSEEAALSPRPPDQTLRRHFALVPPVLTGVGDICAGEMRPCLPDACASQSAAIDRCASSC